MTPSLDRTAILNEYMQANSWTAQDVADICGVTIDDVEVWLDPDDVNQFVVPKNMLCKLTTFENEQARLNLDDAQMAAFCGVPIEYIGAWKSGALPVPQGAMMKLIRGGR